jgi:hypothetical protein
MNKIAVLILIVFCGTSLSAQLSMKKTDGGIIVVDGQKNVLQYVSAPKSMNGEFERCNYVHPLWGMDGEVLTEDFPADHMHHRGVFWAWHEVWIGDKRIGDPWLLEDFEQNVVELEFLKQISGSVKINTEVEWKSNLWKKDGKKVPYMREITNIVIHPAIGNSRKIDFEIRLEALEEGLKIGGSTEGKGYSGFSLRMVLPDDIRFAGPAGEIKPELAAVKSEAYVNISGSIGENGSKGGIVIIDSPENSGYPQSWILREKNSMQNVVFPGRVCIPVAINKPLVLKYSLLVYSGKLSDNKITKLALK